MRAVASVVLVLAELLLTRCANIRNGGTLPTYREPCIRDSVGFDACIKDALNHLLPLLGKRGISELQINTLDPLVVDEMVFDYGSMPDIAGRVIITDTVTTGLSRVKVIRVKSSLDDMKFLMDVEFSIPNGLVVEGDFEMIGRVGRIPVSGEGPFNITTGEIKGIWKMFGNIVEDDWRNSNGSHRFINLMFFGMRPTLSYFRIEAQNVFNGSPRITKIILAFVNRFWKLLYNQSLPVLERNLDLLGRRLLNKVFHNVPYDQLFPRRRSGYHLRGDNYAYHVIHQNHHKEGDPAESYAQYNSGNNDEIDTPSYDENKKHYLDRQKQSHREWRQTFSELPQNPPHNVAIKPDQFNHLSNQALSNANVKAHSSYSHETDDDFQTNYAEDSLAVRNKGSLTQENHLQQTSITNDNSQPSADYHENHQTGSEYHKTSKSNHFPDHPSISHTHTGHSKSNYRSPTSPLVKIPKTYPASSIKYSTSPEPNPGTEQEKIPFNNSDNDYITPQVNEETKTKAETFSTTVSATTTKLTHTETHRQPDTTVQTPDNKNNEATLTTLNKENTTPTAKIQSNQFGSTLNLFGQPGIPLNWKASNKSLIRINQTHALAKESMKITIDKNGTINLKSLFKPQTITNSTLAQESQENEEPTKNHTSNYQMGGHQKNPTPTRVLVETTRNNLEYMEYIKEGGSTRSPGNNKFNFVKIDENGLVHVDLRTHTKSYTGTKIDEESNNTTVTTTIPEENADNRETRNHKEHNTRSNPKKPKPSRARLNQEQIKSLRNSLTSKRNAWAALRQMPKSIHLRQEDISDQIAQHFLSNHKSEMKEAKSVHQPRQYNHREEPAHNMPKRENINNRVQDGQKGAIRIKIGIRDKANQKVQSNSNNKNVEQDETSSLQLADNENMQEGSIIFKKYEDVKGINTPENFEEDELKMIETGKKNNMGLLSGVYQGDKMNVGHEHSTYKLKENRPSEPGNKMPMEQRNPNRPHGSISVLREKDHNGRRPTTNRKPGNHKPMDQIQFERLSQGHQSSSGKVNFFVNHKYEEQSINDPSEGTLREQDQDRQAAISHEERTVVNVPKLNSFYSEIILNKFLV